MDTWQILSLVLVGLLAALYGQERNKRLQATSAMGRELKEMSAKFEIDAFTGLMTLEAFEGVLDESVLAVDRDGGFFSLLWVALDNFEVVQDGLGREFSDHLCREVAQRLFHCAGTEARACKVSNGEFALVCSGGVAVGTPLANRIKNDMDRPFELLGSKAHITCSIGVAVYPEHGVRAKIMRHASLAMRSVKRNGGADYCVYDPQMAVKVREEANLVNDLRLALEGGQFELYFQPKVDAQSMQVTGAEALLRWHHPQKGFVSPVVFIPLAEKFGLMGPIGNWVIEEACRKAAGWSEVGLRMRVAVNISGYQMRQDDLVEHIEAVLSSHGLQAGRFTCEITESVAMEDTKATQLTFEKMRNAGFHVSIDDFGTGYSSLAALRRLPAAELKIDRAFVSDLEESEDARSIAKSIVDMARALNLRVIAEGVETVGQRDILVALGCHELQGYLFSMPIRADELQSMALKRRSGDSTDFRDSLYSTDFQMDIR